MLLRCPWAGSAKVHCVTTFLGNTSGGDSTQLSLRFPAQQASECVDKIVIYYAVRLCEGWMGLNMGVSDHHPVQTFVDSSTLDCLSLASSI